MLPLMPGSEPVQAPVVMPVIDPRRTTTVPRGDPYSSSEASTAMLEGCGCASCQRELARLRDAQQREWPDAAQAVPVTFNWDTGPAGTVTGRSSGANPAPANLPRAVPALFQRLLRRHGGRGDMVDEAPTNRIRGRYDFSAGRHSGSYLHGAERWLDPSDGKCYDTAWSTQWSFDQQPDGTWLEPNNMGVKFVPCEV